MAKSTASDNSPHWWLGELGHQPPYTPMIPSISDEIRGGRSNLLHVLSILVFKIQHIRFLSAAVQIANWQLKILCVCLLPVPVPVPMPMPMPLPLPFACAYRLFHGTLRATPAKDFCPWETSSNRNSNLSAFSARFSCQFSPFGSSAFPVSSPVSFSCQLVLSTDSLDLFHWRWFNLLKSQNWIKRLTNDKKPLNGQMEI